jgi:hypothetical protein
MRYEIKDEKGEVIAELEASPETAAAIAALLEQAAKTQTEKVAAWMSEQGFATGHGDTLEDLLKELTWQVKSLR